MESRCLLAEEEGKGQFWQREHPTGRWYVLGETPLTSARREIRLRRRAEASPGQERFSMTDQNNGAIELFQVRELR